MLGFFPISSIGLVFKSPRWSRQGGVLPDSPGGSKSRPSGNPPLYPPWNVQLVSIEPTLMVDSPGADAPKSQHYKHEQETLRYSEYG